MASPPPVKRIGSLPARGLSRGGAGFPGMGDCRKGGRCPAGASLSQNPVAKVTGRVYRDGMQVTAEPSSVIARTLELCEEIIKDPEVVAHHRKVERFIDDDDARRQYQSLHAKGEELHHKQHAGMKLGDAEVREFEAAREALMQNETVRGFLEAQNELEALQKEIVKRVKLTIELGRVPTEDDLASSGGGCCGGGGCGC